MRAMASQITSLAIVYSIVYSGADQRKHQSSASLAFVGGSHRWPGNSPHKGPVTRKMFPFDDVIMSTGVLIWSPFKRTSSTQHAYYRREPLDEAHDSTFGILENYHCWRFHGSGVIAALQIMFIFLYWCTPWVFFEVVNVLPCSSFIQKIPKIKNCSMDSGVHSVCFRGDFAIKTVVGFLR